MHGNYAAQQYSQAQQPKAPREFDHRDMLAGSMLGGELPERSQPAIPRALEAQSFAGKRLAEAAHELLARLEPILTPETGAQANGQVSRNADGCQLAAAIAKHADDVDGVTDTLRSVLRRLAL